MIFDRPWMKKHGVIIDITNNSLAFLPGHCTHIGPTYLLTQSSFSTEIATFTIEKNITSQKMIKKGLKRRYDQFLANV